MKGVLVNVQCRLLTVSAVYSVVLPCVTLVTLVMFALMNPAVETVGQTTLVGTHILGVGGHFMVSFCKDGNVFQLDAVSQRGREAHCLNSDANGTWEILRKFSWANFI